MVTSIARQSIILKCIRQKSVIVGNYEFYYAAGLMKKCMGFDLNENMKPEELSEHILERLEQASPSNESEEYLVKMLSTFEPDAELYDAQMKELFRWGENEPDLWQVQTTHEGSDWRIVE